MVSNGIQLRSNLVPKRPFAMSEEKEEEAGVQIIERTIWAVCGWNTCHGCRTVTAM
jgi:hypothetical protein